MVDLWFAEHARVLTLGVWAVEPRYDVSVACQHYKDSPLHPLRYPCPTHPVLTIANMPHMPGHAPIVSDQSTAEDRCNPTHKSTEVFLCFYQVNAIHPLLSE